MSNVTPSFSSDSALAALLQQAATSGGGAATSQGASISLPVTALTQAVLQALAKQPLQQIQSISVSPEGQVTAAFADSALPPLTFSLAAGQAEIMLAMAESGLGMALVASNQTTAQGLPQTVTLQNIASAPDAAVPSAPLSVDGGSGASTTPAQQGQSATAAVSVGQSVVLNIQLSTIMAWPLPALQPGQAVVVPETAVAFDSTQDDALSRQQAGTPPQTAEAAAPSNFQAPVSNLPSSQLAPAAAPPINQPALQPDILLQPEASTSAAIATQTVPNLASGSIAPPVNAVDANSTAISPPQSQAQMAQAQSVPIPPVFNFVEAAASPPSLFTIMAAGDGAQGGLPASIEAQLPNGFSFLKFSDQFWLTQALPNLPVGTELALSPRGLAESSASLDTVLRGPDKSVLSALLRTDVPDAMAAVMPGALANPALSLQIRASGGIFLLLTVLQGGFSLPLLRGSDAAFGSLPPALREALMELAARWQNELGDGRGTLVADQAQRLWQSARLPDMPFAWPMPMQLLIQRQIKNRSGQEERERRRKARKVRFLIDVSFKHIGTTQFDGLADRGVLDLAVRSRQAFAAPLQRSLSQRYAELGEACGFTGRLSFYHGEDALLRWQRQRQDSGVAFQA